MAERLAPKHKSGEAWINERVAYAWSISQDPKFIYMIEAEGAWDEKRKSRKIGANGYYDFGQCQINKGYHPEIVNHPEFFNWKWQLDRCWDLYKNGTRFYGIANIWKTKNNFIWD